MTDKIDDTEKKEPESNVVQFSDFHHSPRSWTREQMVENDAHRTEKGVLIFLNTKDGVYDYHIKMSQMSTIEAIALLGIVKSRLENDFT